MTVLLAIADLTERRQIGQPKAAAKIIRAAAKQIVRLEHERTVFLRALKDHTGWSDKQIADLLAMETREIAG